MATALAESLLDDLSTDGLKLHSVKINEFGSKLLTLLQLHGPDIPHHRHHPPQWLVTTIYERIDGERNRNGL